MSYDVCLEMLDALRRPVEIFDVGNYTSNCAPMWGLALGDNMWLSDLEGQMAGNFIERLERAVAHMQAPENEATYAAMNPTNGWGRYDSATEYLARLLDGCRRFPEATIRISH